MSIWFTSDTHFGHAKFLTFEDEHSHKIRPFSTVEEMDETMIDRWNAHVKPGDKVYHLGDVTWNYSQLQGIMARLKGFKRLIVGNHDEIKDPRLLASFQKVLMWRAFKDEGFVCTHVPIIQSCFPGAPGVVVLNVHGHIHEKPDPSPHHLNICVEMTGYRPLHLDEIISIIKERDYSS